MEDKSALETFPRTKDVSTLPPHPFVNESTTKLRKQSSEGTIAGLLFVNGPPVNDT